MLGKLPVTVTIKSSIIDMKTNIFCDGIKYCRSIFFLILHFLIQQLLFMLPHFRNSPFEKISGNGVTPYNILTLSPKLFGYLACLCYASSTLLRLITKKMIACDFKYKFNPSQMNVYVVLETHIRKCCCNEYHAEVGEQKFVLRGLKYCRNTVIEETVLNSMSTTHST